LETRCPNFAEHQPLNKVFGRSETSAAEYEAHYQASKTLIRQPILARPLRSKRQRRRITPDRDMWHVDGQILSNGAVFTDGESCRMVMGR